MSAQPTEAESYRILRSRIDLSRLPKHSRDVTERVIYATADFDYATDLVCDEEALAAAVAALAAGAPVVADGAMVAAGITGCPVVCKIGEPLTAAPGQDGRHLRGRGGGPAGLRRGGPGRGVGGRAARPRRSPRS